MTLATDIVHYFKVVNYILVHHHTKTSKEISDEVYLPQLLVLKIYEQLGISWQDSKISYKRRKEKEKQKIEDPFLLDIQTYKPIHFENIRPPAEYSNKSPYGIADDLHRNPHNYGEVVSGVQNKFGKLNKKHLTSTP